jgi:hypothetical protein
VDDINGTEATGEYYIVCIYRRGPGTNGGKAYLAGGVEDTEGRRQALADYGGLWEALVQGGEWKRPVS